MNLLLLLSAATAFALDLSMPPSKKESRLAMEKKQDDMWREAIQASKTPEFTRMGLLLSAYNVRRCGICGVRVDPRGIYCRVQLRPANGCGEDCGAEVLLVSSKALEKKGFAVSGTAPEAPDDGYVSSGAVRLNRVAVHAAFEKAQYLRGIKTSEFLAPAGARCRR